MIRQKREPKRFLIGQNTEKRFTLAQKTFYFMK